VFKGLTVTNHPQIHVRSLILFSQINLSSTLYRIQNFPSSISMILFYH